VRILVVGGGGREHALLWALRRDAPQATLFCLPGNAGTATLATNLPGQATDVPHVVRTAYAQRCDLVVVGPEAPLAAGVVDRLAEANIPVFGPTAAAARIESSKAFAKELMRRHGVPTADARTFTDLESALAYIGHHEEPLVVKASGLAAGKGALVCSTRTDAKAAASAMLKDRTFGTAGAEILVEEFLEGEELSVLAMTDGEHFTVLPPAQDHKRLRDGDGGPNTGGMGAYSPVSIASEQLLSKVAAQVFSPILAALREQGTQYRGLLYAGLMLRKDGSIAVIEFNCRFGDPEAQAILPVLPGGVLPVLRLVAEGGWMPPGHAFGDARGVSVTTVLAADGYPDSPRLGAAISIPAELESDPSLHVFHAGTTRGADGVLRVAGGRVLAVTATAATVGEAAQRSRAAAEAIGFEGKQFRRDIAWRETARHP
jgi:phosphoribosylamine---glycine ligase